MIQAAYGGRGNGEKDAEGLARAKSGEGSGKWEVGRVDRKERGCREGESGRGQRAGVDGERSNRDGKGVTIWRGQCEEEMERGAMGKGGGGWEVGNGEGGKGKEVGMGKGK